MSVILKALEKAQQERSQDNGDSATVLTLPPVPPPPPEKVIVRRPRYGLIIASVLTSTIVTIVLVAGVLWFVQLRLRDWTQATHTVAPAVPAVAANPGGMAPAVAIPAVSAFAPPSAFVAAGAAAPAAIAAPSHAAAVVTATPVADLPTPVPMSELLREGPTVSDPSAAGAAGAPAVMRAPQAASASKAQAETASSEQGGFVLGPILYDPRSPMAMVNGLSVRQGGVYENFRVLSITPDSVTVQRAGEPPVTLRKR
jgi:hypothetical protein